MNHSRVRGIALGGLFTLTCGIMGCSGVEDPDEVGVLEEALVTRVEVQATLTRTNRWATGYCTRVRVSNPTASSVTGWAATIALDGATLTHAWNATTSVSGDQVVAMARPYNALLAPGAAAEFGYCAEGSAPTLPRVLGASAQPLSDFGAGYRASLRLDSEWSSGYCATVEVQNESTERLWTWGVVLDLHASRVSHVWNAAAVSSGSQLTARPKAYNAVLDPGAKARFGFCARKTGAEFLPTILSPSPDTAKHLTVAVYLPQRIATCFIGDPCAAGAAGCVGLRNDDNELVHAFTDASMQAVRTTSPQRGLAAKEVCVEMVLSPAEHDEIVTELVKYVDDVREWSHGDLDLDLRLVEFERLDLDESRWGIGVWIAPWNLREFALPRLDFLPDFNLVVPPIRDPQQQLHHDLGGCGGTYGADFGLSGAGWSWVPKTRSSFWFECGEQPVFTHEWLHQVHFAYQRLSGFDDLYDWSLPLCRQGDPDATKWFPDSHQCNEDPDYDRCGLNDCGNNDLVNSHILSTHWDPKVHFVANHCRDGIQDFDEVAVDEGPSCGASAASAVAVRAGLPPAGTPTP